MIREEGSEAMSTSLANSRRARNMDLALKICVNKPMRENGKMTGSMVTEFVNTRLETSSKGPGSMVA